LYFILGGVFGLLPDTLDFKFYRFFYRRDIEVAPDPNSADPDMIAGVLAYAVEQCRRTKRPIRVKLNTIRLGADVWQQYAVAFDPDARKVTVTYGPSVTTGRTPLPGSVAPEPRSAIAALPGPVVVEYQNTTTIDIFDGPMFRMTAAPDGRVVIGFLPWHREWSHSLVIALLLGLAGWVIWGRLAGLIVFGAHAAHILVDQLGFMGANLFYPFTRQRAPGFQKFRSFEALPNFALTWSALLLIFWNLYRVTPRVGWHVNLLQLAVLGAVLPLGAVHLLRRAVDRRRTRRQAGATIG
jgi:membrane-bound metal-dependent hydrolase YbcI (DUF457 family)